MSVETSARPLKASASYNSRTTAIAKFDGSSSGAYADDRLAVYWVARPPQRTREFVSFMSRSAVRRMKFAWLLAGAMAASTAAHAQQTAAPPVGASPEINAKFLDPELDADAWVERFEGESREVFNQRKAILAAVALKPGDDVADVGAGTGLFTALFAKTVGAEGWVYAVEISPRFVEFLAARSAEPGLRNITPVFCTARSTNLPPACVDVVFVCDTYHHFEHPQDTLASIHRALRPGGRFVVVDFVREEGVSSEWTLGHVRAGKAVVTSEIEAAGFERLPDPDMPGLRENYLLIFEKPPSAAAR